MNESEAQLCSFDDLEFEDYVKLSDEPTEVKFLANGFLKDKNLFGNVTFIFKVEQQGDEKKLSVTSKRLMAKLAQFHPLKGKVLSITREGTGFDTTYLVEEVA
ncbi:MAG: hypothetical protein DRN14_04815 [Thermoplasmata archaeon]|nr:MAG: hypothetical protein DRN14_04815 [Thermoplasmata archaeon]